jgi:hypothetical protein
MFLRYFRKFQMYTPLLLVVAGAALWADGIALPQRALLLPAPASAILYQVVQPFPLNYPAASIIAALLFLILQAFYLNHIVTSQGLVDRQSHITAILYITLMSSHQELLQMHPILFSNFFLMIGLHQVFKTYNEETVLVEVFNVGMLIAIAGLFYLPSLVFFLFLIISLFVFYIIDLRSFLAAILGLATPFFFSALYFFLSDGLADRARTFHEGLGSMGLPVMELSLPVAILIIFVAAISLLSFSQLVFSYIPDKPIRARKRYWVLVYFFLVAVLSVFFSHPLRIMHLGLVFLPLSVGLAGYFRQVRSRLLPETIFFLLLLIILAGKWTSLQWLF